MEQVLPLIFEFADFATLKQARQVSFSWRREATPKLLEKSRISVPQKLHQFSIPLKNPVNPENFGQEKFDLSPEPKSDYEAESSDSEYEEGDEIISNLDELITLSFPFHPLNLHIVACSRTLSYTEILPGLLSSRRITSLKYSGGNSIYPCCEESLANTEHLSYILLQLPHLRQLDTSCLDLDPEPDSVVNFDLDPNLDLDLDIDPQLRPDNSPPENVVRWQDSLILKLESLDTINLNFWLTSGHLQNFYSFDRNKNKGGESENDQVKVWTKSIRKVKINHEQVVRLYVTLNVQWPISTVDLMLDSQTRSQILNQFLNNVSSTLTHLRLAFFIRRRPISHGSRLTPGDGLDTTRCAHIPRTLCRLTSLDLDITNDDDDDNDLNQLLTSFHSNADNSGQLEFDLWKNVSEAMQLPNLTFLSVRGKVTSYFDGMINHWTCIGEGKLKSDSIQRVDLWPRPFSSPSILFSGMWPQLTQLTVCLDLADSATRIGVFGIFSELAATLEKLELHLLLKAQVCRRSKIINEDNEGDNQSSSNNNNGRHVQIWNCDELLVGLKCPGDYQNRRILEAEKLARTNFKSIRNLEGLKQLKIKTATCCSSHGLTDFAMYNGILFLRTLQGLELTRKFISDRTVADLSRIFGPHVNIRFH